MRLRFIATFALLLATAVTASAQMVGLPGSSTETNQPPIIPFLEGTDVFWTVQRGTGGDSTFPNRLEADLFPHLVATQNFSSTLDIAAQSRRGARRFKEFSVLHLGHARRPHPHAPRRLGTGPDAVVHASRERAIPLDSRIEGLRPIESEVRMSHRRSGSVARSGGGPRGSRRGNAGAGGGAACQRLGGARDCRPSLERAGRVPPDHADTRAIDK